jgi:hypothetical protein
MGTTHGLEAALSSQCSPALDPIEPRSDNVTVQTTLGAKCRLPGSPAWQYFGDTTSRQVQSAPPLTMGVGLFCLLLPSLRPCSEHL